MSQVKFKRISREPIVDTIDLKFSSNTVAQLDSVAEMLSADLGFDVTIEDAVRSLLKNYKAPHRINEALKSAEQVKIETMDKDAQAFMARGEKIYAIKLVREVTNMGLKEAKDYVESKWQADFLKSRTMTPPLYNFASNLKVYAGPMWPTTKVFAVRTEEEMKSDPFRLGERWKA